MKNICKSKCLMKKNCIHSIEHDEVESCSEDCEKALNTGDLSNIGGCSNTEINIDLLIKEVSKK